MDVDCTGKHRIESLSVCLDHNVWRQRMRKKATRNIMQRTLDPFSSAFALLLALFFLSLVLNDSLTNAFITGELYRRPDEIHYGSQAQHPFHVGDCPRRSREDNAHGFPRAKSRYHFLQGGGWCSLHRYPCGRGRAWDHHQEYRNFHVFRVRYGDGNVQPNRGGRGRPRCRCRRQAGRRIERANFQELVPDQLD